MAYNGITNRANDSAVQSDLASTYKKLEMYNGEFGTYPVVTDTATLKTIFIASKESYKINANAYIYCRSDADAAVIGRSKSGTAFYAGSKGSGKIDASAGWTGANGTTCPLAGIATNTTGYNFLWFFGNGAWTW